MKRSLILFASAALVLAACGGGDDNGVASLSDVEPIVSADEVEADVDTEQAILAFAACMRENGVDNFQDPEVDEDGNIRFRFRGGDEDGAPFGDVDRDIVQAAFETCRDELGGVVFGPGASIDLTEVEDQLVEFAACMRENGYDMPDPDLSRLIEPGADPGQGGPFGGEIDPEDPAFQEALEQCQDIFANLPFVGGGGPAGGGGPGSGPPPDGENGGSRP